MHVGNARYLKASDLPNAIPVFPLPGVLLLPEGHLPLNIFEPRYLAMFDAALASHRLIGMVQPALQAAEAGTDGGALSPIGCIGRITSFTETGDGRYIISLTGVCRFRLLEEATSGTPYRVFKHAPFISDLSGEDDDETIDRENLLRVFRAFLDSNQLEADWDSVERASNHVLVNSLSMMSPFGPAEKQALLEAPDLKSRADALIAIMEIVLAQGGTESGTILQ
ncbi:LON peptidase substrate-binding domain-containing protein [Agrobacterium larrymoorei]|uniref:LON peptidase substrate-binding domain-containing protein n=1 Tax=Agrobacterium larrymoorei TaxID=160699 RepID=A0ABX8T837_9HYPH|nr:LON peptidase substrate-binding domain-containing protein [Agrobacterium larrymoorei]QYA09452.1 LON peptidase substrate-binding domain-containing protein [Agrobacterium larrymoorei]